MGNENSYVPNHLGRLDGKQLSCLFWKCNLVQNSDETEGKTIDQGCLFLRKKNKMSNFQVINVKNQKKYIKEKKI